VTDRPRPPARSTTLTPRLNAARASVTDRFGARRRVRTDLFDPHSDHAPRSPPQPPTSSGASKLIVAPVNGAGEELFFRGALHAALEPHRPAIATTIAYVVVTAATGKVALIIAAAVMGVL
jgi:hypothetical protein